MPYSFIFTDTSGWYAYVDGSDAHHSAANRFIHNLTIPLATSTYILDETVTLIKAHLGHNAAVRFGEKLRQEQIAKLLRITTKTNRGHGKSSYSTTTKALASLIVLPLP